MLQISENASAQKTWLYYSKALTEINDHGIIIFVKKRMCYHNEITNDVLLLITIQILTIVWVAFFMVHPVCIYHLLDQGSVS